jgi:hypothetical protein
MLKSYFSHKMCHKADILRSISLIFRELLNINKAYITTYVDGSLNTLKFVDKMFVDIIKFVFISSEFYIYKQNLNALSDY